MFVLPAQKGRIQSLAFSTDSSTLYAAHDCDDVRVWNLTDRTVRSFVEITEKRLDGAPTLLPGGRWAYGSVSRRARPPFEVGFVRLRDSALVDLRTGADYPFFALWTMSGIACALDGSRLIALTPSDRDPDHPQRAGTSAHRLCCWTLSRAGPQYAWHQDVPTDTGGTAVTFLGADRCAGNESASGDGQLVIRRITDGRVEARVPRREAASGVARLLGSPDGTKLVSRLGSELRIWSATDWEKPPTVVAGKFGLHLYTQAAVFHPFAPYLLLATGGPSIVLYDTSTWKPARKWKWDAGGVLRVVAVSPDGTLAAAGGPRGTVVVWDLDL
jgi:WD40 repeat protein